MAESGFDQLITDAVASVLETMFFTPAATDPLAQPNGPMPFRACVEFHGSCSGSAEVRLSKESARMLAANFLGEAEEDLALSDLEMIVCELANMLTGSVVSKLESDQTFDLSSPRLVPDDGRELADELVAATAQRGFQMETGSLTMILRITKAA